MAFQRGAQKAEIAALDRLSGRRTFYLVTFAQNCNESTAGCSPGDLYTPYIEQAWRSVVLQDDEDLKNTALKLAAAATTTCSIRPSRAPASTSRSRA